MTAYVKGPPPHIRGQESVPGLMWKTVLALSPALAVSLFYFRADAVRILIIAIVAAVAAEGLMRLLLRRPVTLYDGHTVLTALLFSMMLPAPVPGWMVALGSFAAVCLGKEIFGGLGQFPFHPAMVGRAFLEVSFPAAMGRFTRPMEGIAASTPLAMLGDGAQDIFPSKLELLLGLHAGAIGETCAVALAIGGLILIAQKIIPWEAPVLFIGTFFLTNWVAGPEPWVSVFSGGIFLAAFFVVADPLTTPLTRKGMRYFAVGTALWVLLLRTWMPYSDGTFYAVLIMNAVTPWIDRWVRPPCANRAGKVNRGDR